jgi:hypothetical protein
MADKIIADASPIPFREDSHPAEIDPLDKGRNLFKKGRLEFMGGPVYFEQGNNSQITEWNMTDGMVTRELTNQDRCQGSGPMKVKSDPMIEDLGLDTTEQ